MTIAAATISTASSAQFLIRDVIFILKRLKLKTESYNNVPIERLDFIVKSLFVGVALHGADNYAL
tara:strand:+ start:244 stop:438 length:195 start_codon:yes stop_codon:yes gene_type:complete